MSAATTAERESRRRWIALVVVCFATLMNSLDGTVVNVALPKIQADLHFTQANLAWVLDAYLVAFGGFLLMSGRLGDLVGRKKVFLVGLALFTAASLVCGLAESQGVLVGARFVQGIASAMSSSVVLAIIATEFPEPAERARAMGAYIFVAVGGGSIGLLAGGAITQAINWHWIFFINLPIGAVTLVLGVLLVKENVGLGWRQGVDVLGSVLVTAGLMMLVYSVVTSTEDGIGSAHTVGFGAAALALLVAFFVLESRLANPIMPLRILRVPGLLRSSVVRAFLFIGMYACFFVGTLYLEHVLGYGALKTGFAFLPMTLVVAAFSLGATARLVGRFGAKRVLLPAIACSIVGLALLSQLGANASYFPLLFIAFLILGAGMGTVFVPLLTIAMAEVPPSDAGLASGIINVSGQVSGAVGVAALGTISTDRTKSLVALGHPLLSALTGGYHLAFAVAAACVLAALLFAAIVLQNPRKAQPGRVGERAPVPAEAGVEAA